MVLTTGTQDGQQPERFSEDWWIDVLLDNPLKLVGLLLLAVLARYLLHRLIDRGVARAAAADPPDRLLGSRRAARVVLGGYGGVLRAAGVAGSHAGIAAQEHRHRWSSA